MQLQKSQRIYARKLPPYPYIIRRVHRSVDEQRRVIWLRFGSLDAMERQWHTATEVKEMTGISTSCQAKIIRRWLERGKQVVSFKCLNGSKIKVSEDMRAMIASPEWLLRQRHLSLEERAAFWKEKLGLQKLSSWSIRQFYLEHGATYRNSSTSRRSSPSRSPES